MSGIELIAAERQRQTEVEGWTPEHDAQHTDGSLSAAAVSYASTASDQVRMQILAKPVGRHSKWPWHGSWWKPSDDPVRNLVKAGALIAAEIDRLQRATTQSRESHNE